MQSQQKRVKWSRGETAEALEERTDTGITMASVELMENCMPDIYGNISRRPALKLLESVTDPSTMDTYFRYDPHMQVIPFYISENDYILLCIHGNITPAESMRIKDGKIVYKFDFNDDAIRLSTQFRRDSDKEYHPLSYAQQNNYLLIACDAQIFKIKIAWYTDTSYALTKETFYFVGGWYAPDGTRTKTINTTDIPGLNFNHDGSGFQPYIANDTAGIGGEVISSTQFSYISTNLANTTANMSLIISKIPTGTIIQFPNNGAYMRVEGYSPHNSEIIAWGSILTPVADEHASDSVVTIEYGFVSLTPAYKLSETFPHPIQLLFLEQRLWAGDWVRGTVESIGESYALTIGSQIAKYNDFKNDYNLENEAITLDILTQYKEKILHLVDYNGLKIMTDSYEYAYKNGSVIKQSGNGSFGDCKPIVFESLCLYCDATGNQIKAMQYEFQSNIFNSSSINTSAPHDLVWYPYCLAGYEDKIHSTGKYLFLINKDEPNYPRISVCNFVPGNQAMIWNRWKLKTTIESEYKQYNFDSTYVTIHNDNTPIVHSSVYLKDGILFMMTLSHASPDNYSGTSNNVVLPAILDFNELSDVAGQVFTFGSKNYYTIGSIKNPTTIPEFKTIANAPINIYSNGEFKFSTTTDEYGEIQADISDLTNITVGLSIDSTIRSHPIDVGGKTKSIKKRIGKARMSVHDTEPGAITINGKTGYMNPAKDLIDFYGVTGMKDEVKYTITNNKGAMFHLESLLMNIEYGTLIS